MKLANPRRGTHATGGADAGSRPARVRVLGAVVALLLIGGGATALLWPHDSGPTDLRGRPVALETGAAPDPLVARKMDAVEDDGGRFVVPSVGLDVPLGALSPVGDTITPPGFTSAYLVRDLGVLPANAPEGTIFVVMHSLRDGAVGPGNFLIDVDRRTARVAQGAAITVAGLTYTVTGSREVAKGDLSRDASVWADEPGRLVVITCLQRPGGGPSIDNVVITAELATTG